MFGIAEVLSLLLSADQRIGRVCQAFFHHTWHALPAAWYTRHHLALTPRDTLFPAGLYLLCAGVSNTASLAHVSYVCGIVPHYHQRAQRHASHGEDHDHRCAVGITALLALSCRCMARRCNLAHGRYRGHGTDCAVQDGQVRAEAVTQSNSSSRYATIARAKTRTSPGMLVRLSGDCAHIPQVWDERGETLCTRRGHMSHDSTRPA